MTKGETGGAKPAFQLHTLNIVIATLAGVISIVGGVYSLKATFLTPKAVYGEVAGFVRDEKLGKPLRLATVEIADITGAVVNTLSTDDEGRYFLKELKEGSYEIKAEAVLHVTQKKKINIQGNKASSIDFSLVPLETQEFRPVVPTASVPAVAAMPSANSGTLAAPASSTAVSPPFENSYSAKDVRAPVPYSGSVPVPNSGGMAYESQQRMYPRSRYPSRRPNGSAASTSGSSGNMNVLLQAGTELVGQMLNERRKTQSGTADSIFSDDSSSQGQN